MSPLASLAVVPILALPGCGKPLPAEGGDESSGNPRVNGVPLPVGAHRVYECEATLTSPDSEGLRIHVGHERHPILLVRTEAGERVSWSALGHLDKSVHRAADPPFPVMARSQGNRTILDWRIHSSRVTANLEWKSPALDRASVEFEVADPLGAGPGDQAPYFMRGECLENRDHPLAKILNEDKRS